MEVLAGPKVVLGPAHLQTISTWTSWAVHCEGR
jgi:hypothetical protein